MTARGTRKGESSQRSMRNGLRPQPARSVRGSSRRIMAMRFRPANIRVINRRASCSLLSALLLDKDQRGTKPTVSFPFGIPILPSTQLRAHQQERVPAKPPVEAAVDARTVLNVKGSLRRAKHRRALDVSAPFRPDGDCDGRLRREHFMDARKDKRPASLLAEESRPENQTPQITRDLTGRSISEIQLQAEL